MDRGIERTFERGLFAARWLVTPIYVGLVAAIVVLLDALTVQGSGASRGYDTACG